MFYALVMHTLYDDICNVCIQIDSEMRQYDPYTNWYGPVLYSGGVSPQGRKKRSIRYCSSCWPFYTKATSVKELFEV